VPQSDFSCVKVWLPPRQVAFQLFWTPCIMELHWKILDLEAMYQYMRRIPVNGKVIQF